MPIPNMWTKPLSAVNTLQTNYEAAQYGLCAELNLSLDPLVYLASS